MNGEVVKTSSDLGTRFAAAVVMIAVAIVAIYVGGWPFRLLVAAAAAVMLLEWGDMHGLGRRWTYGGMVLIGASLLAVSEWLFAAGEVDVYDDVVSIAIESLAPFWTGAGLLLAAAILFGLATRRAAMTWGFLYLALPSFALIILDWAWVDLVFWLMLVTWSTDIFAYFAGRSIGGPRLAPRISPNKTWAGLIGGMTGAAVVGAITAWAFDLGAPFIYAGAAMGLIAQLGDLYESSVKRRRGVKDSGSILPGHGGVLDRLDGLLPVILVTLTMLALTLA